MTVFGPKWPLSNGERDFFKMNTSELDQIKFELRNLLLTSPGENLSDLEYGVGLRRYIFEQNTPSLRTSILSNVTRQISRYITRVSIVDIDVRSDPDMIDRGEISVNIKFRLLTNREVNEIDISVFNEFERGIL